MPYEPTLVEALHSHGLGQTKTYLQLGLKKVGNMAKWLTVENSYIKQHEARVALLGKRETDCVQIRHDGEVTCEE